MPDFALDDISELDKVPGAVAHQVTFTTEGRQGPYMTVEINRSHARIYTSSYHTTPGRGVFAQVESFLLARRRPLWFLFSWRLAYAIFLGPLTFLGLLPRDVIQSNLALYRAVVICSGGFAVVSYFVGAARHCLIDLSVETSPGGFLRRKRDDILLILVGAIITLGLTALLKLLGISLL